jgi:hypothetical protein
MCLRMFLRQMLSIESAKADSAYIPATHDCFEPARAKALEKAAIISVTI